MEQLLLALMRRTVADVLDGAAQGRRDVAAPPDHPAPEVQDYHPAPEVQQAVAGPAPAGVLVLARVCRAGVQPRRLGS